MSKVLENSGIADVAFLSLEEGSIDPTQLSSGTLVHEINQQNRPTWILRLLMNTLEKKRMSKGLGWSRPWNKYGINIFRAHRHRWPDDNGLFELVDMALKMALRDFPEDVRDFSSKLLHDSRKMAFTFYHNHRHEKGDYEGMTISIGRKVQTDQTKRDRLDIILEDFRFLNRVDGKLDRVRIYINPWKENDPDSLTIIDQEFGNDFSPPNEFIDLYQKGIEFYNRNKNEKERQWSHWANRYIDYFGPRNFIPLGSQFL